jgi:hypothetical protein
MKSLVNRLLGYTQFFSHFIYTMNQIAFQARLNVIEKASQSMIVRNNFLTSPRVLAVTKVPSGHAESLKDIQASVGFTESADFMKRQDEGG